MRNPPHPAGSAADPDGAVRSGAAPGSAGRACRCRAIRVIPPAQRGRRGSAARRLQGCGRKAGKSRIDGAEFFPGPQLPGVWRSRGIARRCGRWIRSSTPSISILRTCRRGSNWVTPSCTVATPTRRSPSTTRPSSCEPNTRRPSMASRGSTRLAASSTRRSSSSIVPSTSNRGYADAYTHLGDLYLSLGQLDEAVRLLKEAVAIRPDFARGLNRLALAYSRLGLFNEAVSTIHEAIALEPREPEHRVTLARVDLQLRPGGQRRTGPAGGAEPRP